MDFQELTWMISHVQVPRNSKKNKSGLIRSLADKEFINRSFTGFIFYKISTGEILMNQEDYLGKLSIYLRGFQLRSPCFHEYENAFLARTRPD